MGRPLKNGIDFFAFDCDFFTDDKTRLIGAEFGANGVLIYLYLLCEIYRSYGYFKPYDADICLLIADGIPCKCDAKTVEKAVSGYLKRSLFNRELFEKYGILTSAGIQRRYLRACEKRKEIRMVKDYFLLDASSAIDIPDTMLERIRFISSPGNEDISPENEVFSGTNTQSKRNRKKKDNKADESIPAPTLEAITDFCHDEKLDIDTGRFLNYYSARGWKTNNGALIVDWRAQARIWARNEKKEAKEKSFKSSDLEYILEHGLDSYREEG